MMLWRLSGKHFRMADRPAFNAGSFKTYQDQISPSEGDPIHVPGDVPLNCGPVKVCDAAAGFPHWKTARHTRRPTTSVQKLSMAREAQTLRCELKQVAAGAKKLQGPPGDSDPPLIPIPIEAAASALSATSCQSNSKPSLKSSMTASSESWDCLKLCQSIKIPGLEEGL